MYGFSGNCWANTVNEKMKEKESLKEVSKFVGKFEVVHRSNLIFFVIQSKPSTVK